MPARKVERTKTFAGNLKALSKKHPDLSEAVDSALDGYAAEGESSTSFKIPRLKGLPVFKDRIAFGNQGKSGAARNCLLLRFGTSVAALPVLEVETGEYADKGDSGRPEVGWPSRT